MLVLTEITPHVTGRNFIVRPAGFITGSAVTDAQTYLGLSGLLRKSFGRRSW